MIWDRTTVNIDGELCVFFLLLFDFIVVREHFHVGLIMKLIDLYDGLLCGLYWIIHTLERSVHSAGIGQGVYESLLGKLAG